MLARQCPHRRWADNDGTSFRHGNACSGVSMTAVAHENARSWIRQALASSLIETTQDAFSFTPKSGMFVGVSCFR